MATNSTSYGIHYPARCISALIGEKESTVFVVGTISVQQDNEVHLFEVPDHGEPRRLGDKPFKHPKEIWDLAPSPTESDLLFTTYRDPTADKPLTFHSSLWKIEHHSGNLRELTVLDHSSSIKRLRWNHSGNVIATLNDSSISILDVESTSKIQNETKIGDGKIRKGNVLVWEPHFPDQVAVGTGTNCIQSWDTRANTIAWEIESVHAQKVLDVDFNPNLPYTLASSGDDCCIKFWDYKKTSEPVQIIQLSSHSHWVWNAKYNLEYDQFLASCSSDSFVNLWDVTDISSNAPPPTSSALPVQSKDEDHWLTRTYEDHDESVYSLAWGCGKDPFVFASLSHDQSSCAVICRVPQEDISKTLGVLC